MKKLLIISAVLCVTIPANSQLRVDSDGAAYFQRSDESGEASLSVGTLPGLSNYTYDSWKTGIRSYGYNTASTGNVIGVFGEALQQYSNHDNFSAGVWGIGGGAYQGKSYGVMGTLHIF